MGTVEYEVLRLIWERARKKKGPRLLGAKLRGVPSVEDDALAVTVALLRGRVSTKRR
jgi:hypothetical protein